MKSLSDQKAVLKDNMIVCYGFYVAGSGQVGLPSSHQVYVTVTPNYGNWMGQVAPQDSSQAGKHFSSLVLPAVHDIGMNSMETPNALLQKCGAAFVETLKGAERVFAAVANDMSASIILAVAPNIISSLAVTQKDSVDTVLQIGSRYFEFRPAHIFDKLLPCGLPDTLYFMHGPIPGMVYDSFLHDVANFLKGHPTEIVVVQLRWDGVPQNCAHASEKELTDAITKALNESGINVGNLDDMQNKSIQDLRNENKRFILFNNGSVYSTYDDAGNATLNGDSIVAEFERLDNNQMHGRALTNIQCQATSTNIRDVIIHSAIDSHASNSCLLSTKAICDSKTLPWIKDHALEKLTNPEGLIVVMNDFFDGATADIAIGLSKKRLG